MTTLTPQQIAERCTALLWKADLASQGMGMGLIRVGPGMASVRMHITEGMANCLGACHGGYVFALADTAFAYASNSFNQQAVAAGVDINYLAPARIGDTLTATGQARHQGGRNGLYDIEVINQEGEPIALFRGRSARLRKQIFDNESDPL